MNNLSIAIIVCILVVVCIISSSNISVTEGFRTSASYGPLLRPARPYRFYKTKWDNARNLIWFNDWGYTQRPYRACDTCAHKTKKRCADCTTCGWCKPIGYAGRCEPGNEFRPYVARDCHDWDYDGKSIGLY